MVASITQQPFAPQPGDQNVDAFWDAIVRQPSRTMAPWRQYARSGFDPRFYWVNDDATLALAEQFTPCAYAGGLDFEHVTEIPCLTLALDLPDDLDPGPFARMVERHRARLKLPEPHFELYDPASERLHLVWHIRPLHKPPKSAAGQNHYAWNRIRSSWKTAQLKLALAFELLGAKPTPAIFVPKLPLPHPSHRSTDLGLDAELVRARTALPAYYVRDVSEPLDKTEFERRAFKVLRPARRLPGFLVGGKGWVESETFKKAAEPKTEGGRHPAAVTIACCLRWSGCEAPAIEKYLRAWAATHPSQAGFPAVRPRGDEISLLTEWAVKNLIPGGPRREAKKRGNYAQKASALSAVAAVLMSNEAHLRPWEGTQRELCAQAQQLVGVKLAKRTLQALLPELREIYGLETAVHRVGKTWVTAWRLSTAVDPKTISEAFTPPRDEDDLLVALFNQEPANEDGSLPQKATQQSLFLAGSSERKKSLGPTRSEIARLRSLQTVPFVFQTLQPESNFASQKPEETEVPDTVFPLSELAFLHSLGLSLIPLQPRSKVARGRWAPAQKKQTSLEALETALSAHPDSNIAVVTGETSGVVVVDLDSEAALEWAQENLPPTPIKTASSETRQHWYYRHPRDGRVTSKGLVRGRSDVQIKADGGYVLAPFALHPLGHRYSVVEEWTRAGWAEMPVFDRALIEAPKREPDGPVDSAEKFFGVFNRKKP